jgi:hypothetical protein
MFAGGIRRARVSRTRGFRHGRLHLDDLGCRDHKEIGRCANIHKHFSLGRTSLTDRPTYNERRSAALAEWQALAS